MNDLCYGSWETGYRCGVCAECGTTRPSRLQRPTEAQLLGELRAAARNDKHAAYVMTLARRDGFSPLHAATMLAVAQMDRANELERQYLALVNSIPMPLMMLKGYFDAPPRD